jgi:acyl homoserine lactone synthase
MRASVKTGWEAPMYITVQSSEFDQYKHLLRQMFRLRKRVFYDSFGWDVKPIGDEERDKYDELNPVYLLWTSDDMETLFGSSRIMPTTGPTLLYDVFRDTFPVDVDFSAPSIWEVTRSCIDREAMQRGGIDMSSNRAMCLIMLCLYEFSVAHRIETLVTNYAPYIRRSIRSCGVPFEEIGCSRAFGSSPVYCGLFEISEAGLQEMRNTLSVRKPLCQKHSAHDRMETLRSTTSKG